MVMTTSFEQVTGVLERHAAAGTMIGYNELAEELALPPVNNLFHNSPLNLFFQQIDADDAEEQRPFRTAVVVQKGTKRPGSGFYRSLEALRGIAISAEDEISVWKKEISDLTTYYSPNQTERALWIALSPAQSRRLDALSRRYDQAPELLLQRTLSRLLAYLEDEAVATEEARAQVERGETYPHEAVMARIEERMRR
jgi:predicted transcriptional regulator